MTTSVSAPLLRNIHFLLLMLMMVTVSATASAASALKSAEKELEKVMRGWVVIPKIDVGSLAGFHVLPNGWPVEGKEQGKVRGWGVSKEVKASVCVRKGQRYNFKNSGAGVWGDTLAIEAFTCGFKIKVYFDHKITPKDLQPERVALAISSVFEVEGVNDDAGSVLGMLQDSLEVMEVHDDRTDFLTISFSSPKGRHEVDKTGNQIRFVDSRVKTAASHRELTPEEQAAGARLLMQESLPLKLLTNTRRQDSNSRVLSIGVLQRSGPLDIGYSDVSYSNVYERHVWVIHADRRKLYTIVSKGSAQDQQLIASVNEGVGESVHLMAAGGSAGLLAELPTPEGLTPQPRPVPAQSIRIEDFQTSVKPARLRPGETIRVSMDFTVETGIARRLAYTETRALRFNGRMVPNYPRKKSGSFDSGSHSSTLAETVPVGAPPGVYECESEVCVEGVCESGTVLFQVTAE